MTSLSMKTYLFCEIFTLLFLETRADIIVSTAIAPMPSVQAQTEVTSHHTASPAVVTSSTSPTPLPLRSTNKTRTATEKLFTHNVGVSGTERPSHKATSSIATTEREVTVTAETKSGKSTPALQTSTHTPALTSGRATAANKSTDATTETTESAKNFTQAASVAPKSTSSLTTSFTPTTQRLNTVESTSSATNPQNITNRVSSQTSAMTKLQATTGSVLQNYTETTESVKNLSTTTPSPPTKQSTEGPHIGTTAFSNSTANITDILPTNATILVTTNATQGGWIHVKTKTSPPNPTKVTETTANTEAQPCSSRDLVNKCLIVIASLAAVATVFIVCTIVLCTRLSSRKYKLRRQHQGTEMMCISSLMPERTNHRPVRYTRQRSPVPNGVLVIHNFDDSDDEMGDNLTLSSFLPENDRYV